MLSQKALNGPTVWEGEGYPRPTYCTTKNRHEEICSDKTGLVSRIDLVPAAPQPPPIGGIDGATSCTAASCASCAILASSSSVGLSLASMHALFLASTTPFTHFGVPSTDNRTRAGPKGRTVVVARRPLTGIHPHISTNCSFGSPSSAELVPPCAREPLSALTLESLLLVPTNHADFGALVIQKHLLVPRML